MGALDYLDVSLVLFVAVVVLVAVVTTLLFGLTPPSPGGSPHRPPVPGAVIVGVLGGGFVVWYVRWLRDALSETA